MPVWVKDGVFERERLQVQLVVGVFVRDELGVCVHEVLFDEDAEGERECVSDPVDDIVFVPEWVDERVEEGVIVNDGVGERDLLNVVVLEGV